LVEPASLRRTGALRLSGFVLFITFFLRCSAILKIFVKVGLLHENPSVPFN